MKFLSYLIVTVVFLSISFSTNNSLTLIRQKDVSLSFAGLNSSKVKTALAKPLAKMVVFALEAELPN